MAGNSDLRATPLEDLSVETGTRPRAPTLPDATDAQRAKGRHLAAIHAHYLCGQGCQMLTMHHNIEEHHLFPEIEGKAAPFTALIARLREEHKVVHELLDRLAACSERLTRSPDAAGFAETRAVFAALHRAIQSHFGYEERELEAAIGVYMDRI